MENYLETLFFVLFSYLSINQCFTTIKCYPYLQPLNYDHLSLFVMLLTQYVIKLSQYLLIFSFHSSLDYSHSCFPSYFPPTYPHSIITILLLLSNLHHLLLPLNQYQQFLVLYLPTSFLLLLSGCYHPTHEF